MSNLKGASPASRYLEDFVPGEVIHTPRWRVSEQELISFAECYDPQYYHTDPDTASESIYGGLVAGGFQTAALTWALALRTRLFDRCAMAGIGLEGLRWFKPLRPDDTVRCEITVLSNRPSRSKPDRGVIEARYDLFNQHDIKILTLTLTQMLARRPAASG
ncbi:MAG: MaoC/PaaZ C-terminal domain-containing protein [Gammaproteobacteria bacterium]|nr:MaoC/PaaZ C-terminal domain-containing protein [Gammaproteobacteria bacterium]MDH3466526.1 MaoC/PaaZ C-terminal domain-containing protein [Gammaproteobacteria bacterium]